MGTVLTSLDRTQLSLRSDVENGTPSTRQSHTLIRIDRFKHWPSTLILMEETCRMTLLSFLLMETLFLTNTLTQPVFQHQEMSMMDPHALLLDGARMSLELLVSIKLFSRRLTFQWSVMEYARTS